MTAIMTMTNGTTNAGLCIDGPFPRSSSFTTESSHRLSAFSNAFDSVGCAQNAGLGCALTGQFGIPPSGEEALAHDRHESLQVSTIAGHWLHSDSGGCQELTNLGSVLEHVQRHAADDHAVGRPAVSMGGRE